MLQTALITAPSPTFADGIASLSIFLIKSNPDFPLCGDKLSELAAF